MVLRSLCPLSFLSMDAYLGETKKYPNCFSIRLLRTGEVASSKSAGINPLFFLSRMFSSWYISLRWNSEYRLRIAGKWIYSLHWSERRWFRHSSSENKEVGEQCLLSVGSSCYSFQRKHSFGQRDQWMRLAYLSYGHRRLPAFDVLPSIRDEFGKIEGRFDLAPIRLRGRDQGKACNRDGMSCSGSCFWLPSVPLSASRSL